MGESLFEKQLEKRILILDGAMGTMIQGLNLSAEDFGGEEYEGCNEYLVLTKPNAIYQIHCEYLAAGADMIETNTFGATSLVLKEYNLEHLAREINLAAAKLAKKAAMKYATNDWPRFVAGAMGPTTKSLSVTGGVTFHELVDTYKEQAEALITGGVDLLLLETSQDLRNVKAAFLGIKQAFKQCKKELPLMISGTIEPMGTTLAGQSIEAFYLSIEHMNPAVVGLNCATGPEFMRDHIRSLADLSTSRISCYPNAGLPDEEGCYHESPESFAKKMLGFAEKGWINVVGGCCGTTPDHIRALREVLVHVKPHERNSTHPHAVSGIEPLVYDDSMRPLFVGERTNVIGSKKFRELITNEKYEEAAEIARAQVKKGAHIIDVCLANPDRDEKEDMEKFIAQVINKVKVPFMIDSTDEEVIKKALTYLQGKSLINSINLEDGEERFLKVVPLIKAFGAAVVVGTIDEKGMAITREKKLEVAKRSYDLLVNKYGLKETDIIFDPLVFPVGTGDEQYIGSAKETIEGIRLIKEAMPNCLTILGISNVSFGLPQVGREVLNAVFLYECTKAGLDYAIVNTEKLKRYASISEEERHLSEELLYQTNNDTLAKFTAHFRSKKVEQKQDTKTLPLDDRLALYVVEGSKDGLYDDLAEALKKYDNPLDIINGPLMNGMGEVGRLFNQNELIVAEVLQSAEVMKASVSYLEPYMESKGDAGKGKILLATVKGDVHDIGKNLVEIILSNNGFEVINLGIKVPPHELIEAIKREKPDAIGLSGLLVKSAQQMVLTAQDLKQAKISIPILIGGAALTRKFTDLKISPQYDGLVLYAKDAMEGLDVANQLSDETKRKELAQTYYERLKEVKIKQSKAKEQQVEMTQAVKKESSVSKNTPLFVPNDTKRHLLKEYPLDQISPYINLQMLLGHHLGLKGKIYSMLEEGDRKAIELKGVIDGLIKEAIIKKWITANAVYQFFPAQADGDDIIFYHPLDEKTEIERFHFPRQNKGNYLCLSDYVKDKTSGVMDYVGLFNVTCGIGVQSVAKQLKESGDYLRSHAFQALALELAEGFAERIHEMMRDQWGFPDPVDFTMQDRFSAKYQGIRVSFGYPACPNIEDQSKLFRLLHPEDIGVRLTEGYMMEPEASVSAMVFSHPEARYFNV